MSKPLDALFFVSCAGYCLLQEKADRLKQIAWTSLMLLSDLLRVIGRGANENGQSAVELHPKDARSIGIGRVT